MFNNNHTAIIGDMPRSIEAIEQELKEAKVAKRREALFDRYEQNKKNLANALDANDDELSYKLACSFTQRYRNLHPKSDSAE